MGSKKIPLPFVVQPKLQPTTVKVGNDDVGVLEIKRYGYLTAGEKAQYQQVDLQPKGPGTLLLFVDNIVKNENKTKDEVLSVLSNLEGKSEDEWPDWLIKYTSELLDLYSKFTEDTNTDILVKAGVLLISRVNSELEWADIMELPPELLSSIADLYDLEEQRSLAALPSEYSVEAQKEATAAEAAENARKGTKLSNGNSSKKVAQT